MARLLHFLCLFGLLTVAAPGGAAPSSFDLLGPRLDVTVQRGDRTLPLEWVPNLSEGDRVTIKLDRPKTRNERYRMVAAFLRGAVDRPAKDWFHQAESWKPKGSELSLVVPKGAEQMAIFVVPESGGGTNAIIGAVRKQPGAFVRAVQELNQASLDRARLDAFLREMLQAERENPASVNAASQILTRSLSIKLKAECLQQPVELQAACLTGDRETLLLTDTHSSALADTLAGAPTDLAFQLSATPQAGYGSYSSYIGVVRDLFRLFGAFQSTQLQFIPALVQMGGGRATILLNTPLSFAKPTSVMVVAMPAIEAPKPPPLRRTEPDLALCALPGLVLPVEGAPLVFATRYAHNTMIRVTRIDGTVVEVPVEADPRRGGFVMADGLPKGGFAPSIEGQLHGDWGFATFDGPTFQLSTAQAGDWKPAEQTSLVVGRSNEVTLLGGGAGCVKQVGMRRGDGPVQPVAWKQSGPSGIVATLPLNKTAPGPVSIVVEGVTGTPPVTLTLTALQEAGSLDELVFHAGDEEAVLTGSRLDQVKTVTLAGLVFQPGVLTRVDKQDRLTLVPNDPAAARAIAAGRTVTADVTFAAGRHKSLAVTVELQPVGATLLRISAQAPPRDGTLPIALRTEGVFAQDTRLTFAFHLEAPTPLSGLESIEIGTADGRATTSIGAGKGFDLQDSATGIVTFDPARVLGPLAYGALRFRVVRDGTASSWTHLATIVRLPEVRRMTCARSSGCTLVGDRLFLIKAIATNEQFEPLQEVPDGFVDSEIKTRPASNGRLFLRLRDAPEAVATLTAQ
ncbi:hypothetical protein [Glacieibacterium sp.]|uniref:hypothetical protein n=1 Tax=Glacieibacterium sp. TaxID=2860237 RepID=UPI003B00CC28